MEIKILVITLMMMVNSLYSSAQAITDKSWTYSSILAVSNDLQDTTTVYSLDPNNPQGQIATNRMVFRTDSTYLVLINNSVVIDGSWKIDSNYFIMDNDTMTILLITNQKISLRGNHSYFDSTGAIISGYILVNYVKGYESVESIKSGDWHDPATWSSGRIPNKTDNVVIKQPHRVILSDDINGYCKNFLVELGAIFDCKTDKALVINPNDN